MTMLKKNNHSLDLLLFDSGAAFWPFNSGLSLIFFEIIIYWKNFINLERCFRVILKVAWTAIESWMQGIIKNLFCISLNARAYSSVNILGATCSPTPWSCTRTPSSSSGTRPQRQWIMSTTASRLKSQHNERPLMGDFLLITIDI